ncbi:acyltransferase family protein [Antrihabitans cavernicola]|uniref:Acyltransferase n=1 Tax=Antrihabitans cavernicola TaxID=2495913 RepID=A0A5A7S9P2_9NOCA|nr:acyltransferase family protein [Spelaeibacter cavernicola]KAA0021265.1 acyltransferase [Spelaeibacter cavernicola]
MNRTVAISGRVSAGPSSEHRHDLDGLRGLAIGLVVLFHVWADRVSGGVDIFLTLSGFFFTGTLLRRSTTSGPPIMAVLRRTARRLLPPLVAVLATVVAVTVAYLPYTRWEATGREVIASLLYFQNWALAASPANYRTADPAVSPMQHLWSMSVQVQFYLFSLLAIAGIAWLCRHFDLPLRRVVTAGVLLLGLASFWYATDLGGRAQSLAYYDTFARSWELFAGALLAVVAYRITLSAPVRNAVSVVALMVVLGCGVFIDGVDHYPGPLALVPVGAAFALIALGSDTSAGRLLATRPFTELGRLAYSLYLWHWPVLIGYLLLRDRPSVGVLGGVFVIGVSLALAWLTNRLIEEPLRTGTGRIRGIAIGVVGLLVLASACVWQVRLATDPALSGRVPILDPVQYPGAAALYAAAPVPDMPMRPTVLEAPNELPVSTPDGCFADLPESRVISCTYGRPNADRTIALVGGSHSEFWLTALDAIGKQRGIRIDTYLKAACPLTSDPEPVFGDQPYLACREWSDDVMNRLTQTRPDQIFTTSTRPRDDRPGDFTPDNYADVWQQLSDRGLSVLAIRDTPWLPESAPDCLANGGDGERCGVPRSQALDAVNPALERIDTMSGVSSLDLTDDVCGELTCAAVVGNVLVYHDMHHLTVTYVRTLTAPLDRQIGAATGWW